MAIWRLWSAASRCCSQIARSMTSVLVCSFEIDSCDKIQYLFTLAAWHCTAARSWYRPFHASDLWVRTKSCKHVWNLRIRCFSRSNSPRRRYRLVARSAQEGRALSEAAARCRSVGPRAARAHDVRNLRTQRARALYTIHEIIVYRVSILVHFNTRNT